MNTVALSSVVQRSRRAPPDDELHRAPPACGLCPFAYVLTRTVGLPFDTGDVGNWGDRLGIASLFVEGVVVFTAACALRLEPRVLDGAGGPAPTSL